MLFNKKPGEDTPHAFSSGMVEPAHAPHQSGGSPTRSVVDSWLTIRGNLESEGEVQVNGQICGDMRCTHLTVGKGATIDGNVTAEEVVVRGTVKGAIRANRVILQENAHVDGEIYHRSLAVEEGATFEGQSRRQENPVGAVVDMKAGKKAFAAA